MHSYSSPESQSGPPLGQRSYEISRRAYASLSDFETFNEAIRKVLKQAVVCT